MFSSSIAEVDAVSLGANVRREAEVLEALTKDIDKAEGTFFRSKPSPRE